MDDDGDDDDNLVDNVLENINKCFTKFVRYLDFSLVFISEKKRMALFANSVSLQRTCFVSAMNCQINVKHIFDNTRGEIRASLKPQDTCKELCLYIPKKTGNF